jgi:hypothetical protein
MKLSVAMTQCAIGNTRYSPDLCHLGITWNSREDAVDLVVLKRALSRAFQKHPSDGSVYARSIELKGAHDNANDPAALYAKHRACDVAGGRAQGSSP